MVDVARAQAKAGELQGKLVDLQTALGQVASASDRAAAEEAVSTKLSDLLREIRDLEVAIRGKGIEFGDFFSKVGDSLVSAQRGLDRQTREYLREDPVHPSAFRIPKLTAEFKFAMESKSKDQFNVLFFGSSDEERKRQQHRINFEVVAAPPPAAYLAKMGGIPLSGALLRHPADRNEVQRVLAAWLESMEGVPVGPNKLTLMEDVQSFLTSFDQVLVLEGSDAWVLMRTTPLLDAKKLEKNKPQAEPDQLEILTFTKSIGAPGDDHIWRAGNVTKSLRAALGVLRQLARQQWEYLLRARAESGESG
jgi:hypothetical protein